MCAGLALLAAGCSTPEDDAGQAREAVSAAIARRDWSAAQAALQQLRTSRPESPEAVSEYATLLVAAGEAPEALWVLEDAVARFPASDELRVALADAALRMGEPGRARLAAAAVASTSDASADALVRRALAELELGDVARARRALDAARTAAGDSPSPELGRRLELTRLGVEAFEAEGEADLSALSGRVETEPQDTLAWSLLEKALRRHGRSDEARERLEAAIEREPGRIDLHPLLVSAHAALGDDAAAERVMRERIERHPTPGAHISLARFRAGKGETDAALARYGLATQDFPDSAMLRSGRTELLIDVGLLDDARLEYEAFKGVARRGAQSDYLLARIELAGEEPALALRRLSEVVGQIDSDSTRYWLGRALEAADDRAGAEEQYRIAAVAAPRRSAPAFAAARLASERGDWRAALGYARAAVEQAPYDFENRALLAHVLPQLGEWKEAEERAREAVERFPERTEPRMWLAESLHGQQRLDEALAVLDTAETVRAERQKERARRRARRRGRAAPELPDEAPGIAAHRGLVLAARGDRVAALEVVDEALEASPDYAWLHTVRGAILLGTERSAEGSRAIEHALSLDPEDLRPLRTRAEFHVSRGQFDAARRDCDAYLAKRPDDPRIHFVLGVALSGTGRVDEAMDAYRRSAELDPKDWGARNNLAMLLESRGEYDAALELAEVAYANAPDNLYVLDTLGLVYTRTGQPERGIPLLEKALERAPQFPEVYLHLAQAYHDAGRRSDARRVLLDLRRLAAKNPNVVKQVDAAIRALEESSG